MSGEVERVHGTAIALGNRAALIRGPSGTGKSDLAFRCIGLGASDLVREPVKLIADDQVILRQDSSGIVASAPSTIRGKLEVRGLGILEVDAVAEANLVLIADLVSGGGVERYPDPWPQARILGLEVPLIHLYPFENSSALKLVTAITMAPWSRFAP